MIFMTVKELIEKLKMFPDDFEVVDNMFEDVSVYEVTWVHSNYPYDKEDRQVVMIK